MAMYWNKLSVRLKGRGKRRGSRGGCRRRERERPAPLRVNCRPWQQNEGHSSTRDRGAAFEGQSAGYEVHPWSQGHSGIAFRR